MQLSVDSASCAAVLLLNDPFLHSGTGAKDCSMTDCGTSAGTFLSLANDTDHKFVGLFPSSKAELRQVDAILSARDDQLEAQNAQFLNTLNAVVSKVNTLTPVSPASFMRGWRQKWHNVDPLESSALRRRDSLTYEIWPRAFL